MRSVYGRAPPATPGSGAVSLAQAGRLALLLLISSVICSAILNQGLAQDFLTKSRVVGDVEDVIVRHSPVHVENKLAARDPINLRLRERVSVRLHEYHFARLNYSTARSINQGIVNGFKRVIFFQRMQDGLGVKIEGWGMPAVGDMQRNKKIRLWPEVRRVGTDDTYPSPLVDAQCVMHFAPLESGKSGVGDQNDEHQNFQNEFRVPETSFKPYLKVAEAFFHLCCAFVFVALGLVHI
jgi:hypothetical protein